MKGEEWTRNKADGARVKIKLKNKQIKEGFFEILTMGNKIKEIPFNIHLVAQLPFLHNRNGQQNSPTVKIKWGQIKRET